MTDAVSRLIVERSGLEREFRTSLLASGATHAGLVVLVLGASLFRREPPLKVMDGFAVVMPRGGGGPRVTRPAPQVEAPPAPKPEPEAPAPKPKVIKPPKEVPDPKRLPELDSKKVPEKSKKPAVRAPVETAPSTSASAAASVSGGGVGLVPGPGVPDGTDVAGDWYLAGVQRKVWSLWMQSLHAGMSQAAIVSFSINADGSVSDVRLMQSSGAGGIDLAAQRSVYSAQPFGPLPKTYGTNRITIQAFFKPDA